MSYIITSHRPGKYELPIEKGDRYSRTVVATLDEARAVIYAVPDLPNDENGVGMVMALTAAGGTVGPLLDGTVIDVVFCE